VVPGGLAINCAKGKGWGDDRNEKQERDCDGFLVEIRHFFNPVAANGSFEVIDDSPAPHLRFVQVDLSGTFDEGVVIFRGLHVCFFRDCR
jgi:hypothetical protein